MIKKANYDFESKHVELKFMFSELTLLRLKFNGIQYHLNPFESSHIMLATPRINGLDYLGHKIALGISYPLLKKLPIISIRNSNIYYNSKKYNRYFIDCTTDFEKYLIGFQSKTRTTLRRKLKKIESSFNNVFLNYSKLRKKLMIFANCQFNI